MRKPELDLLNEIKITLLTSKGANFVCHKCGKMFPSKMLMPESYKGELLLFCGYCKQELINELRASTKESE